MRGIDNRYLDYAVKRARDTQEAWAVVELDSDDGEHRVLRCMPLDATNYDEFLAWEGVILAVVEVDGSVDVVQGAIL